MNKSDSEINLDLLIQLNNSFPTSPLPRSLGNNLRDDQIYGNRFQNSTDLDESNLRNNTITRSDSIPYQHTVPTLPQIDRPSVMNNMIRPNQLYDVSNQTMLLQPVILKPISSIHRNTNELPSYRQSSTSPHLFQFNTTHSISMNNNNISSSLLLQPSTDPPTIRMLSTDPFDTSSFSSLDHLDKAASNWPWSLQRPDTDTENITINNNNSNNSNNNNNNTEMNTSWNTGEHSNFIPHHSNSIPFNNMADTNNDVVITQHGHNTNNIYNENNSKTILWERHYSALLEYCRLNGHANVPNRSSFECDLVLDDSSIYHYSGRLGKW